MTNVLCIYLLHKSVMATKYTVLYTVYETDIICDFFFPIFTYILR